MKVLITGCNGQLGTALQSYKSEFCEIIPLDRKNLNLENRNECINAIDYYKPAWVINSGAYTSVDGAESNPKIAFSVNSDAPRYLAEAISSIGGKMLQISTDFVFDGKRKKPYLIGDKRNPINIYGKSKAGGEKAIEDVLFESKQGYILRTSWLMGPVGQNFTLTMLNLHNKSKFIKVVNDQMGSPTNVYGLASVCWKILETIESNRSKRLIPQILHWSDAGITSWYEIAQVIGEMGSDLGLIGQPAKVIPISSSEFKSKAQRPLYSSLDCKKTSKILNLTQTNWRVGLMETLKAIADRKANF